MNAQRENSIASIGVIGAGQMGGGIAQVAAAAGVEVTVVDATRELADRGVGKVLAAVDKLVAKGKLDEGAAGALKRRIRTSDRYEDLGGCDLVIEAATEKIELKQEIFRRMDRAARPGAILATNTSSISITLLGAQTKRPERVIGMHFMNPVPVMKLVEVIRALPTDDETYDATVALARRLGKEVVTSKDIPGFIVNRILIPMLNEACFALQESLGTARDIDTGIKLGLNHPMGPFELADLIGLDTVLSIAEVLQRELGDDKYRPSPLLRQYVAAGWLGRKSGRGFHRYDQG
jgi:3-hydroxybutyryl-CoA dehydrogenase